MIRKIDIGLALSKNFDKVSLSISDEEIEFETDEEMKAKIRKIFNLLRDEVELEFKKIQGAKN